MVYRPPVYWGSRAASQMTRVGIPPAVGWDARRGQGCVVTSRSLWEWGRAGESCGFPVTCLEPDASALNTPALGGLESRRCRRKGWRSGAVGGGGFRVGPGGRRRRRRRGREEEGGGGGGGGGERWE
ncbi:hypothetical protein chiPu_0011229 [Chiloscyllium punctatum]|uniref:Uncharacterized protein n=1 Tax=Chiloscyllium punctatum TaxID=137246 RepID=A0A401SQT9_CHIPU|nr:hypothetical protein [Chiloscyllium punctatum]